MRHRDRLSNQQRKFLRALRNEPATLEKLVERHRIGPFVVSRWLRSVVFRDALAEVIKEVRAIGDLELLLTFRAALRVLTDMVEGKITSGHLRREACFNVMDGYLRRPKSADPKPEKVPPPEAAPSAHPSHSPERAAELIEQLRVMQEQRLRVADAARDAKLDGTS